MRRPPRLLAAVLAAVTVIALTGCSARDDGPTVLPADPLCEIFPAGQISPMLPPGDYTYAEKGDRYQKIWYDSEFVYLDGGCYVTSGPPGAFTVMIDLGTSFTECSSATIFWEPLETV